jgi:hypothetical protein
MQTNRRVFGRPRWVNSIPALFKALAKVVTPENVPE